MRYISLFRVAMVLLAFALPTFADLPTPYSFERIEGRIVKIEKLTVLGKACRVIRISNASGLDRKAASALLKVIRRSGYDPDRKTLRDNEIVIVLPDTITPTLTEGDKILIDGYFIGAHDNRTLATEGEAKRVTKVDKPEQVMPPNGP